MTGLALGIDGGGTATRWRLEAPEGSCIAEGQAAPVSGHIDQAGQRERTFAALGTIIEGALGHGAIRSIVAGLTGVDEGSPASAAISALLAERSGARAQVFGDMWIAYHAAFAPGEGIVIYSGTGSIAFHVTADGQPSRAGGHGYLIDDGGSAAWIALRALRLLLRGLDETPEAMRATPLYAALAEAMGSAEWDTVRAFVYGDTDRGRLGNLARAVGLAAAAGDAAAADLLRTAGGELARLGTILARRHGRKPVALLGGTLAVSPLVHKGVAARMAGTVFVEPRRTPVEAAAALARHALPG